MCACMCECVCACVCARGACTGQRGCCVPWSIPLHLIPLRQGLSLDLELGGGQSVPAILLSLSLLSPGVTLFCLHSVLWLLAHGAPPCFFHGCWGFKLRLSHLLGRRSYLLSHLASPLLCSVESALNHSLLLQEMLKVCAHPGARESLCMPPR